MNTNAYNSLCQYKYKSSPGESYGLWCNTGFHRNIIKFSATCALQIGTFDLPVIQPPIALLKPLTGWVWLAVMRSEK